MKLRMRLICSYTILAIAASIIMGFSYNNYANQRYINTITNNAKLQAAQMVNLFDDSQNKMEQVAEFILSDQNTLSAIRSLALEMAEPKANKSDIVNNQAIVRRSINTAYNLDNFYRVIIYNNYGYVAASANAKDKLVNTELKGTDIPWIGEVQATKGRFMLVSAHADDWGIKKQPELVYSVVKEIQGKNLGYIEIQKSIIDLSRIFEGHESKAEVLALQESSGKIIYCTEDREEEVYKQYLYLEDGAYQLRNKESGKDELIVKQASDKSDIVIITLLDWEEAMGDIPKTGWMTAGIILSFLVLSILFIIITASLLTAPIRQLREKMEHTDIANMDQKIEIASADEDIQALTQSYRELLERLWDSVTQEKKLALLQLQAQFDTLQTQVNPHFIYNVLNVISGRGIQDNDEKICEICGNLASMLRYSTSTKERYATIDDELNYLKNYVYLLEARFEKRLQVKIQISDHIKKEIMPKITLQQLVENSIEHGYHNTSGDMNIEVRGYENEMGWFIEVEDNGEGILEQAHDELLKKIEWMRSKLTDRKEIVEMEIGGMGLANTYGRMYLLYQDAVVFDLKNRELNQGALAIIGVKKRRL